MTSKNDNRWVVISTIVVAFGFMCFVLILWKIGLFDFSGTAASAKIVASALALVGGLFGSIVTLIGIFLKHSIDQRSQRRLKLETAIRAVELLTTSSGEDVPMTQRAAVLFTLANLGLTRLALTMMSQMLSSDRIDANSTTWLINHALESNDTGTQLEASALMRKHSDKFLTEKGGASFPECLLYTWNPQLPVYVREDAAMALLQMVVSRPVQEWEQGILNAIILTLISLWKTEPQHRIRTGVGICLEKALQTYSAGSTIYPSSGPVSIDDIRNELSDLPRDPRLIITDDYARISKLLDEWVKPIG